MRELLRVLQSYDHLLKKVKENMQQQTITDLRTENGMWAAYHSVQQPF